MICYCKTEIPKGARRIIVGVTVDWGDQDEREQQPEKRGTFCSFKCLADWASDRAAAHDGHVVTSPEESHESSEPVVDDTADTVIRGR